MNWAQVAVIVIGCLGSTVAVGGSDPPGILDGHEVTKRATIYGMSGVARVAILVDDQDCTPLPGARLEITSVKANGLRARATAETGGAVKMNITPGVYRIAVSHPGFAKEETLLTVPAAGVSIEMTMRRQVHE